jgi:hypothetical protein
MVNGYSAHANKTSPHGHPSPPNSPAMASLKLPYALISPDIYSHSDGVTRVPLSRHELVQQYAPLVLRHTASKLTRGKFIRSYRWGSMDVLDPVHSDFMPLRTAIFHHMEVGIPVVQLLMSPLKPTLVLDASEIYSRISF